ncbi:hypothetical protein CCH79_00001991, partial [Gambusia affinis]
MGGAQDAGDAAKRSRYLCHKRRPQGPRRRAVEGGGGLPLGCRRLCEVPGFSMQQTLSASLTTQVPRLRIRGQRREGGGVHRKTVSGMGAGGRIGGQTCANGDIFLGLKSRTCPGKRGRLNSIRHNLSLHSRFVRIQNEGTGKSSWWMLNPEGGKNGKSPRRRAVSMDNNNKFIKSKGRATKKKMSLQEGVEGEGSSPGSQYCNWLGSPNSHNSEDFEAWSSFRTRTSSDASTLSGRRSPFPSEKEDLVESDRHMLFPATSGTKITSSLPSLSEVSGPMVQHGSERVMESLLDNLHLLSPKAPQHGSDSPRSPNNAGLQSGSYGSAGMSQDYSKCMYSQVRLNSLSPVPMQTLPENKPGFGGYENQYICPAGLLKELLTTDAGSSRDIMPSSDRRVSDTGRVSSLMSAYSSHNHIARHPGIKIITPLQSHPGLHVNPQSIHSQGPAPSRDLNSCNMIPLASLTTVSGAPQRLNRLRTCMQPPQGHLAHTNDFSASYTNSYKELNLVHPHSHHQERLPSDLDNMPIERLECDLESVLHDTLMDGGALDFNFDPAAGFPQRVKSTSHSWVSEILKRLKRRSRVGSNPISVMGEEVEVAEECEYLCVRLDKRLAWRRNSEAVYKRRLDFLRKLRPFKLPDSSLDNYRTSGDDYTKSRKGLVSSRSFDSGDALLMLEFMLRERLPGASRSPSRVWANSSMWSEHRVWKLGALDNWIVTNINRRMRWHTPASKMRLHHVATSPEESEEAAEIRLWLQTALVPLVITQGWSSTQDDSIVGGSICSKLMQPHSPLRASASMKPGVHKNINLLKSIRLSPTK